jgi:hypothetical protein
VRERIGADAGLPGDFAGPMALESSCFRHGPGV